MRNGSKDIVMLGMKDEVLSIDISYIDDREMLLIVDFIHHIAWKELLSRPIRSMHDWSQRAETVFHFYDFNLVGQLATLSKSEVRRLERCGYKTRKEVYDVCKLYGLTLPNWEPGIYYARTKPNYIFRD